ncbi:enoyl-CoA hydratase [Endogone sp. FLAS-F59071]|nr:enoyl-CoA hydratase [Endogone sp. FLAS-F59071]|eukprot:RUS22385.1 enoyl-CoA hydratase [Endogone sp. FLAS-F59071]
MGCDVVSCVHLTVRPTRMILSKPVIAAVSGYAVAGGLELACWCDIRVADETALFGVFCRLRGVPLIDGGTIRLPKLIGRSAAMDMILTGRSVTAQEAHSFRLVNLLATPPETALAAANMLASHPQRCMRSDRRSVYDVDSERGAMQREFELGMEVLKSQEFRDRVTDFLARDGRSKRMGLIAAKNKSSL